MPCVAPAGSGERLWGTLKEPLMRSSWWLGWDTTCVLELGPPWHTDRTAGAENHQWLQACFVSRRGWLQLQVAGQGRAGQWPLE